MLKQIVNGRILTPKGWLEGGSVIIEDNKIKAVSNIDLDSLMPKSSTLKVVM